MARTDILAGEDSTRIITIKKENKEEQNEMFSTIREALNQDEECFKYCNMTKREIIQKIKIQRDELVESCDKLIPYFRETAKHDIMLFFDSVFTAIMPFTMYECYNVCKKIVARFEKINAENDKFYGMSLQEKNTIVEREINRWIPTLQAQYYADFIQSEKTSPFSIYTKFIDEIQAQDFIIRGDFISIQYDNNGNFIIIKIPEFLKEINTMIVSHMIINFTYQQSLQFGTSNAILDLEAMGYRFNILHGSIDTMDQTSVFIRKNVSKGKSKEMTPADFDYDNYYYGLFSELPDTDELAVSILNNSNKARKKLQYKFDGFKAKNFVDINYNLDWFIDACREGQFSSRTIPEDQFDYFKQQMEGIEDDGDDTSDIIVGFDLLTTEQKMEVAKEALIDVMRKYIEDKNPLIVGPTGSGKSTLLAKVLTQKQLINPEQNLLTIEDTPELHIPYCIAYQTNKKYKIHDVFVATLRQNPSRVLIGETRGIEIIDILETCLTAKSGTTCHATDFPKLEQRLKLMVGDKMPTDDLFRLTVAAVDIVVFIVARKVTGVYIRNNAFYNPNGGSIKDCYERIM